MAGQVSGQKERRRLARKAVGGDDAAHGRPHHCRVIPMTLSDAAAKALDVAPTEIVARWLASVSADARRAYARALRRFTEWAIPDAADPQEGLRLLCEAGAGGAHELLTAWRDHLLETLAPGTTAGAVSAIASLLRCCRRVGLIVFSIEGVAPKREKVQDRRGPRRADVERLVEHIDALGETGDCRAIRDAAIVRLLYVGALRRCEVTELRLEDVDIAAGTVSPRRKGYRARKSLSVSPKTLVALRAWLAVRGAEDGALFHRMDRADHRDHLTGESIRHMLKTRAKEAGVKVPCRPHGMRHSAATQVASCASLSTLKEVGGLGMFMAVGGWRSLTAAQDYVDPRPEERVRGHAILDL